MKTKIGYNHLLMFYAAYTQHKVGPKQLALLISKRGDGSGLLQKALNSGWRWVDNYNFKRKTKLPFHTNIMDLVKIANDFENN